MKLLTIEATDMGNNQDEIAEEVYNLVADHDFKTEAEFYEMEGKLITQACKNLNWQSVPQNGGLVPNWDSSDGEFSNA